MARSRALRFKLMSIRRHHQKDPLRRILRKSPKTRCIAAAPDRKAARIPSLPRCEVPIRSPSRFAGDHAAPGGQSILDLSFGWVVENHQGVPRPFRIGVDVVEPQMQTFRAAQSSPAVEEGDHHIALVVPHEKVRMGRCTGAIVSHPLRRNCRPAHRQGASADPRTARAALDPSRTGAQRRPRPGGLRGSLYETGRPTRAPLPVARRMDEAALMLESSDVDGTSLKMPSSSHSRRGLQFERWRRVR
jgi:hypothetical protein